MAKYDITRKCGHVEVVQIAGPVNGRENKAQFEATKICKDCYLAKMEAERLQEAQKALEQGQYLPALTGSEKQITWALTIRQGVLSRQSEIADMIEAKTPEANKARAYEILSQAVKNLENQTAASWWIDNRDVKIETEMRRCM